MGSIKKIHKIKKNHEYVEKMLKNVKLYKKNLHESKVFITFAR